MLPTRVSIPHWFSLNTRVQGICAQISHVSIPHWFSLNWSEKVILTAPCTSFHPTLVLAQLKEKDVIAEARVFPSHIGSRSTDKRNSTTYHPFSFHPTLVLAQPMPAKVKSNTASFHPTLVLAQRNKQEIQETRKRVSIPHWFSLNVVAPDTGPTAIRFPSHIGSRSTKHFSRRQNNFTVSIPHWFSLNPT